MSVQVQDVNEKTVLWRAGEASKPDALHTNRLRLSVDFCTCNGNRGNLIFSFRDNDYSRICSLMSRELFALPLLISTKMFTNDDDQALQRRCRHAST